MMNSFCLTKKIEIELCQALAVCGYKCINCNSTLDELFNDAIKFQNDFDCLLFPSNPTRIICFRCVRTSDKLDDLLFIPNYNDELDVFDTTHQRS